MTWSDWLQVRHGDEAPIAKLSRTMSVSGQIIIIDVLLVIGKID